MRAPQQGHVDHQAYEMLARETEFARRHGNTPLDVAASGHPCIVIDPTGRVATPSQTRFHFV